MPESSRILFALRDTQEAAYLGAALRPAGFEACVASDAVGALTLARREPPSIVVADAALPGGGGATLVVRLRGNVHTALVPTVGVITDAGQAQAFLDAGARECLTAPVGVDALKTLIARILDRPAPITRAPKELIADPERLLVLDDTGLLDSPAEPVFDQLTGLASALLPAPVALVSLVDRERQYFKSQLGVGEPWASQRETPLTHSFCQWAVASREPLVVGDARLHPLLRDNRAVDELGVIAYAGIPIMVRDQALGALCAIGSEPREWEDQEIAILSSLAEICSAEILLRLATEAADDDEVLRAMSAGVAGATELLGVPLATARSENAEVIVGMVGHLSQRLAAFTGQSSCLPAAGA